MVKTEQWFSESWIKTVSKSDFVAWCKANKKIYSEADAMWIYDHVNGEADKPVNEPVKADPIKEVPDVESEIH